MPFTVNIEALEEKYSAAVGGGEPSNSETAICNGVSRPPHDELSAPPWHYSRTRRPLEQPTGVGSILVCVVTWTADFGAPTAAAAPVDWEFRSRLLGTMDLCARLGAGR